MAVVVRLQRGGTKKKAFYRVVAADSRFPRDGRFLEIIGTYDPRAAANQVNLKVDKLEEWVKKGAQMSETVKGLYKIAKAANA